MVNAIFQPPERRPWARGVPLALATAKVQHSKMRPVCLLVALLLYCPSHAHAWGRLGHEAMARVAQGWLSNNVAARVTAILGTNDLASVALWADDVRDAQRMRGRLRGDPEAHDFNRRFPQNENWHYVNLPLATTRYVEGTPFVSTNDIVTATRRCITVLEGRSAEMSKRDALRWLVHLVGDIHQPLHVGCGYYRFKPDGAVELLREPDAAAGQPHDRGGNLLRFSEKQNLHAFWDVALPEASSADEDLESTLRKAVQPQTWKSEGTVEEWPRQWAADAVVAARAAYQNIEFLGAQFDTSGAVTNISVKLPSDYQAKHAPRARDQLSKSAFRLAELLNALRWD